MRWLWSDPAKVILVIALFAAAIILSRQAYAGPKHACEARGGTWTMHYKTPMCDMPTPEMSR
jgi:hypothetical protein